MRQEAWRAHTGCQHFSRGPAGAAALVIGGLPLAHLLLGLLVVAVWGTNFVVIHEGLEDLPPLVFAALRFTLAAFPAIFFLRRPEAALAKLAAYGLLIGVGQFGILFIAMDGHISPGLASLVIQLQVFFTIGLSAWLTGERLKAGQVRALGLASAGIALIGINTDGSASWLGLFLVVAAAGSWGIANIVTRTTPGANMLAYMAWSSLFAVPVLWVLALLVEGASTTLASIGSARSAAWLAVLWQTIGNTLFGFAAWAWLLARHPSAVIVPIALLVPVFGMGASALLLGEPMPPWKVIAGLMVLTGLAAGLFTSLARQPKAVASAGPKA